MRIGRVLATMAIAGFALTLVAQSTDAPAGVTQQPYTAVYKHTSVKTLADGSDVTTESTEVDMVDSKGRVRMDSTGSSTKEKPSETQIHVSDPVNHTLAYWSLAGKTATVLNAPDVGDPNDECARKMKAIDALHPVAAGGAKPRIEDLGTATINGIAARGGRVQFTVAVRNIGNAMPYVRTNEMWTATDPDLNGLKVRVVSDAGQFGKTTQELAKLTRGEPDPAVFKVPQDRTVTTKDGRAYYCDIKTRVVSPAPAPSQQPPIQ
jgi:hypothetical protein